MLILDKLMLVQDAFSLAADLSIEPGAHVAVIGPSGAGKSTLLSAIAGFLPPVSGRLIWDGAEITNTAPGARPLSIIFQDNNLFPHLTAAQNIGLGLKPSLRMNPSEMANVESVLKRVGLTGFGHRKPGALSGGQQSRVSLARALLRQRPLLLLDEPFAALGPALKTEMLDLVSELARAHDTTVLMVTHDPGDAARLADQTILVADGIAHPPKATTALLADPPDALRDYLR